MMDEAVLKIIASVAAAISISSVFRALSDPKAQDILRKKKKKKKKKA